MEIDLDPKTSLEVAAKAFSTDVVMTPFEPGRGFPLFIQPNVAKLYDDTEYAISWLNEKRPAIEQLLLSSGAVVLRGFPIERTSQFERVADGYGWFEHGYMAGTGQRPVISGKILAVSTAIDSFTFPIHQEMSYLPTYPERIAFYCRMPAVSGGETLICDMLEASRRIDPVFFHEVEKRGIRYVRNFRRPGASIGHPDLDRVNKTWAEAFFTDDPAQAEANSKAMGFETTWCDDGSLESVFNAPGVIMHPRTGERLWFNQVMAMVTGRHTNPKLFRFQKELHNAGKKVPYRHTYGDGTEISDDMADSVNDVLRDLAVAFAWSYGDILLLDNYTVGHGRNPFIGQRDIQVALLVGKS